MNAAVTITITTIVMTNSEAASAISAVSATVQARLVPLP